jgi:uncharacterized repeat protein (TIGR01451 family)
LYVGTGARGVREFSVQPDLQITATTPDAPTPYGVPATFSYRVHNAGPFDATNVRTQVQLPATATNITASSPGASCNVAGSVVTCVTSILRTDSNADITITAVQPAAGTFTVTGTVEGDQPDDATADNSVTSNVSTVEMADLSVTISAPARVTRGEAINLSVTVRNNGPNDASSAAFIFELPNGLNVASVTPSAGTCTSNGNAVSCQIARVPSGASVTIAIVSAATSATGALAHVAVVDASGLDLLASNDSAGAATTVSEPPSSGGGGGGGGGGSLSWFMLAALLLLSRLRVLGKEI